MNVGDLDQYYDVPATATARLIGGPYDGREQPFPGTLLLGPMPRLYFLAPPPDGLPLVGATAGPPPRIEQVVYEALRGADGFVSRDDAGRVRFDFWGQW
jgi:hypothetical protein